MGLKGVFLFTPYTNGFFGGGGYANLFISSDMNLFSYRELFKFIWFLLKYIWFNFILFFLNFIWLKYFFIQVYFSFYKLYLIQHYFIFFKFYLIKKFFIQVYLIYYSILLDSSIFDKKFKFILVIQVYLNNTQLYLI